MTNRTYTTQRGDTTYVIAVPSDAEMEMNYRPGRAWSHLVQRVLDSVDFNKDPDWIFHYYKFTDEHFNMRVVEVKSRSVRWGMAAAHKRLINPQPSPFVILERPKKTPYLSVELFNRNGEWVLERLYPGKEYTPLLPWQMAVETAPGGRSLSEMFWSKFAFSYQPRFILDQRPFDQLNEIPPQWARQLR